MPAASLPQVLQSPLVLTPIRNEKHNLRTQREEIGRAESSDIELREGCITVHFDP
jgi:hypothetical protein